MDRAARDEQFLGQRRLARVGVRDDGEGAAVGVRGHGSGPANCVFEASKWQRHWVRAGAAGSIATRKAARTQDRSHFGVPSGYGQFCPEPRRRALEYSHMSAPRTESLNQIGPNLDYTIDSSSPQRRYLTLRQGQAQRP